MKRSLKAISSLFLALALVMGISITAAAADSSVTFLGHSEGFAFEPGSVYTTTDLFDGFKEVMPGDTLTEEISVTNQAKDCDYIKLYMRAEAHDEATNPLSPNVAASEETVATMSDFLAQLSMQVYNGGELIFDASPDQTDGLTENVLLGQFRRGESTTLTVNLTVPADLGNEYAYRVGEVDWVFTVEGLENRDLTVRKVWVNGKNAQPKQVTVDLLQNGDVYDTVTLSKSNDWTYTWEGLEKDGNTWTVKETDVPKGYTPSYSEKGERVTITNTHKNATVIDKLIQTGQLNWPILVLGGLGAALIVCGVLFNKKRKQDRA